MFFSKRKYGKYKKVDMRTHYSEIRSFLDNICTCNLFRSDRNPLKDRMNEECLFSNETLSIKGDRFSVGDRSFDIYPNPFDTIKPSAYIGQDLIFEVPRGYDGDCTYYRLVKIS